MGVKVKEWKGAYWVFVNHQRKRRAVKCANKKAAEIIATKIDAALKLGQTEVLDGLDKPAVPTFREYTERWLAQIQSKIRPSTLDDYQRRVRRLDSFLGALPLDQITRAAVRMAISTLAQAQANGKPRFARGTLKETLNTLASILGTAEEDGLISTNPARRQGKKCLPPAEVTEVEVFRLAELGAILAVAEEAYPHYYPFLFALARTGLREGEAIALEWADVDFANRVLLVRRTERRGRVHTPKNHTVRRVDMSLQLTECLRNWKSLQESEAALEGRPYPERVFTNSEGRPINVNTLQNVWESILRRADVRYRKIHCLRHTFASLLIEAGVPVTYIQQQLGHHSAAFTLKVYGHLIPRGKRRDVDVLDDPTGRNPRATNESAAGTKANVLQ